MVVYSNHTRTGEGDSIYMSRIFELIEISRDITEKGNSARRELYEMGFIPFCNVVCDVTELICRDGKILTTSGYSDWTWRNSKW